MIVCWQYKTKFTLFLVFVSLLVSCKKDLTTTRADFVAVRSGLTFNYSDSININAYSVSMDSIPTNGLSRNVLGHFNDPLTGEMGATLIHQITLPINQFSWAGAPKLDSLVLRLRLSSLDNNFGNPNSIRTFKAYLLDEDLTWDSLYFSSRRPKIKTLGTEIGSFTGIVNIADTTTTTLGSKKLSFPPHIRIPMNNAFIKDFFEAESKGYFLDVSTFKSAFKGIVIVDETNDATGNGAIFFVNPRSVNSALYAYFDTTVAEFAIKDRQEVVYNYFYHSNTLNNLLQKPFTGSHRDTGFLVPLSGSKLRVELTDFLDKFGNKNIILNSATITFTVLPGNHIAPYKLPNKLSFFASDSLGRNGFLRDNILEPENYFGGFLNNADNTYTFAITRHLQQMLNLYKQNRNINYGFNLLIPSDNPISASRVLLDTRKNANSIKLKLNFTVVN
ncbi:MAG: DUF4270 family protein [Bacteroidia bacterium]